MISLGHTFTKTSDGMDDKVDRKPNPPTNARGHARQSTQHTEPRQTERHNSRRQLEFGSAVGICGKSVLEPRTFNSSCKAQKVYFLCVSLFKIKHHVRRIYEEKQCFFSCLTILTSFGEVRSREPPPGASVVVSHYCSHRHKSSAAKNCE